MLESNPLVNEKRTSLNMTWIIIKKSHFWVFVFSRFRCEEQKWLVSSQTVDQKQNIFRWDLTYSVSENNRAEKSFLVLHGSLIRQYLNFRKPNVLFHVQNIIIRKFHIFLLARSFEDFASNSKTKSNRSPRKFKDIGAIEFSARLANALKLLTTLLTKRFWDARESVAVSGDIKQVTIEMKTNVRVIFQLPQQLAEKILSLWSSKSIKRNHHFSKAQFSNSAWD